MLKIPVQRRQGLGPIGSGTGLLVLVFVVLDEFGPARNRNELHPLERPSHLVHLLVSELQPQAVRTIFDILLHHAAVDADRVDRQRVGHKLPPKIDGIADDLHQSLLRRILPVSRNRAENHALTEHGWASPRRGTADRSHKRDEKNDGKTEALLKQRPKPAASETVMMSMFTITLTMMVLMKLLTMTTA